MEHISPLAQTFLWVGLLTACFVKFRNPVYALLVALEKRVLEGSSIKAGPIEIGALMPQLPSRQKEKAAAELQEALSEASSSELPTALEPTPQKRRALYEKYFQAEDLALRAIQAEYGATMRRQVTAGLDRGFDGVFVSNGQLSIVEVKYLSRPSSSMLPLGKAIDGIYASIFRYGWQNARVILAVVVEKMEDVSETTTRLQRFIETKSTPVPLVVRCFSLEELQAEFGFSETPNAHTARNRSA